jgi:hypothetical protein
MQLKLFRSNDPANRGLQTGVLKKQCCQMQMKSIVLKKYATLNYINFHFLAFGVSLLKLIMNSMLAFTLWYLYTKIKRWEQTIERRQKYFYCYDLFREESLEETVIKLRENWERELVLERIDLVSNCVLTLINQNACKENFLNWWLTVQLGIVFLSYF